MTITNSKINVRVFLDGKEIKASELSSITISNTTVDRIINEVAERVNNSVKEVPNITA